MENLNNSLVYDPSESTTHESRELVHRTIVDVRRATDDEVFIEGWEAATPRPMVIILDDGTKIYASCDEKGTGPGVLFLLVPEDADGARIWHKQRVHRLDS